MQVNMTDRMIRRPDVSSVISMGCVLLCLMLLGSIPCQAQESDLEGQMGTYERMTGSEADSFNKQWVNIMQRLLKSIKQCDTLEGLTFIRDTMTEVKMIMINDYNFLGKGAEFLSSKPFLELCISRFASLLDILIVNAFQNLGMHYWDDLKKSRAFFSQGISAGGTEAQRDSSATHICAVKSCEADEKIETRKYSEYLGKISNAKPNNPFQRKSAGIRSKFIAEISKVSQKLPDAIRKLAESAREIEDSIKKLEEMLPSANEKKKQMILQMIEQLKNAKTEIEKLHDYMEESKTALCG